MVPDEVIKSFPCVAGEPLQITYSYWDGTGHRRVIQVFNDQLGIILFSCRFLSSFESCICFLFSFRHEKVIELESFCGLYSSNSLLSFGRLGLPR